MRLKKETEEYFWQQNCFCKNDKGILMYGLKQPGSVGAPEVAVL